MDLTNFHFEHLVGKPRLWLLGLFSLLALLAALLKLYTILLHSLSEKRATGFKPKAGSNLLNLKTQFPPSRREVLPASCPNPKTEAYRKDPNRYSHLRSERRRPPPKPCPEFDIKAASFRPYRPFRWTYHQTMSLSKMQPDYWIELEKNYFDSLKQRKALLEQHGSTIMNYALGSELACRELMEMVLQFVCIRYPHYFALEESNTVFVNRLLDTRTDITSTHPLHVLFDNIPEDFPIMMRDEKDGNYCLRAGYICSSIGWTFGTHFNRPLRAIHTERGAWFIEDWKPLLISPEEYALNAGTRYQGETVPIEQCYLRVDWQTLRRLPLSGAVVFNFKAVFSPVVELREEPYIPALLYKQVTEGKRVITEPKVHKHILRVVLQALKEWKKEQVEKGVVERDWEEETLQESPFYPGWDETWKRRGGLGFS
ncbi:hypothetical protein BJY00DRAFT_324399 [Aspergillus carlsbadensis]|nr:hypothetical protein BJY00DRAFT_324399 [Aspergillus carlsbadensis]